MNFAEGVWLGVMLAVMVVLPLWLLRLPLRAATAGHRDPAAEALRREGSTSTSCSGERWNPRASPRPQRQARAAVTPRPWVCELSTHGELLLRTQLPRGRTLPERARLVRTRGGPPEASPLRSSTPTRAPRASQPNGSAITPPSLATEPSHVESPASGSAVGSRGLAGEAGGRRGETRIS